MEIRIKQLVEKYFGATCINIKALGGGFYGRVFLVNIDKEPFKVVIKLYLFPYMAKKEALQIRTLATYAKVKMPNIYFVDISEDGKYDAVAMNFINGVNAGDLKNISQATINQLSNEIIDNLIAYHNVVNSAGFGPLDSKIFLPDWRQYYKPIAISILQKAEKLLHENKLNITAFEAMEKAVIMFDKVFYLPITQARLIHGDYNTWNVMLTEDLQHVEAVIDPFNCCWADSEFDLYQLDNANGKDFNLFTIYSTKVKLSENFKIKKEFYELFTELNHFYDAGIEIEKSNILFQATTLSNSLMKL